MRRASRPRGPDPVNGHNCPHWCHRDHTFDALTAAPRALPQRQQPPEGRSAAALAHPRVDNLASGPRLPTHPRAPPRALDPSSVDLNRVPLGQPHRGPLRVFKRVTLANTDDFEHVTRRALRLPLTTATATAILAHSTHPVNRIRSIRPVNVETALAWCRPWIWPTSDHAGCHIVRSARTARTALSTCSSVL